MAAFAHLDHWGAHLPPRVRDRKSRLFGGSFVVVHSLGARTPKHHVWWAIVESMRTWIIQRNFQIPPLYVDDDEHSERRRRAGVPKRRARRSQGAEASVPRHRHAAQGGGDTLNRYGLSHQVDR